MKFTRTGFFALFITISLIAATTIGVLYNSASAEHKTEQSKIDTAQLILSVLNKQKTDLAPKLAQAAADIASWNDKIALLQTTLAESGSTLKQAQAQFPATVATIEYNETLMALAKSSNLTMSTIVATGASSANISTPDFAFNTNVFTISLSGKVSDILGFVDKLTTHPGFSTAAITPLTFSIPLPFVPEPLPAPLTQAVKDQMRAEIKAKMLADVDTLVVGVDRVTFIEQCLLELLGNNSSGPTLTQMTQTIHDAIALQVSPQAANLVSEQIALAIENNLASSLIGTIAQTYSNAISALFSADSGNLLPVFTYALSNDITSAIQNVPSSQVSGVVTKVITDALNSKLSAKIAALVSDSSIDAALKTAVDAAQQAAIDAVQQDNAAAAAATPLPNAQITVAVYSFKGE